MGIISVITLIMPFIVFIVYTMIVNEGGVKQFFQDSFFGYLFTSLKMIFFSGHLEDEEVKERMKVFSKAKACETFAETCPQIFISFCAFFMVDSLNEKVFFMKGDVQLFSLIISLLSLTCSILILGLKYSIP